MLNRRVAPLFADRCLTCTEDGNKLFLKALDFATKQGYRLKVIRTDYSKDDRAVADGYNIKQPFMVINNKGVNLYEI